LNPFGYEKTSGLLDGLTAVAKAFFLGCLSIAVMGYGLLPLLALFAAGIVLHAAEGISFRPTAKASVYILWLAAFAAVLRGILPGDGRFFAVETLGESGRYALRLLLIFLYARLFYVSTRVADLGNSLTGLVRFLNSKAESRGISTDPGMLLILSMLFLPRTFDSYARVRDAAALRGFAPGRVKFRQFSRMMETLVFMGMKNALLAARALETRGYSSLRTIQIPRLKTSDALAAGLGIALVLVSGLPGVSLV
jgi:energy-coupling factor transporter transmembrane protein EcfT